MIISPRFVLGLTLLDPMGTGHYFACLRIRPRQFVNNIRKDGVGFFWHSISMDLKKNLTEFQTFLRNEE